MTVETWVNMEKLKLSSYDVSNLGRIRNKTSLTVLSLNPDENSGYVLKSLTSDDKKRKQYSVHRLVLMTFDKPQPKGHTCDHINRIKTDNRLINLRWATHSEQNLNKKPNKPRIINIILKLDCNNNVLNRYTSIKAASGNNECLGRKISKAIKTGSMLLDNFWKYEDGGKDETWRATKIHNVEMMVSDMGRFKRNERMINGSVKGGYRRLKVGKKHVYAHVLVALVFLVNNDMTKQIVNHIDGNKLNNKIDNLEWTSCSDNIKHSFSMKGSTRKQIAVKQVDLISDKDISKFVSIQAASDATGVPRWSITTALRTGKEAGGYIWCKV